MIVWELTPQTIVNYRQVVISYHARGQTDADFTAVKRTNELSAIIYKQSTYKYGKFHLNRKSSKVFRNGVKLFNPRTCKQSHTPAVVQGGGRVDGTPPWVFGMLQHFENISP